MAVYEWNDFLVALAIASGMLLAVALAMFQLSPQGWRLNALKQAVALLAVVQLATPVFFSLIALLPLHPWKVAGALVGVVGYAVVVNQVVQYVRYPGHTDTTDVLHLWLIIINVAVFSILLWVPSLAWKAGTCVWLIVSGLIESWHILTRPEKR